MTESQIELWNRISTFSIDATEVALPFTRRLARETGWSLNYSERVVEEYRRFLFLCCEAGHTCTPSEEVDEAWHLHLVYTRSYWDRLCPEVLGRPLHHDPTQGGTVQDAKFDDCYSRTLDSYRKFFGEPPSDIWPTNEIRFGRVPVRAKPKLDFKRPLTMATGAVLTTILVGGCVATATGGNRSTPLGVMLAIIAVFVVLVAVVIALASGGKGSSARRGSGGCGSGGGCGSSSKDSDGGSDGGSNGCGSSGCGGGCGGGD